MICLYRNSVCHQRIPVDAMAPTLGPAKAIPPAVRDADIAAMMTLVVNGSACSAVAAAAPAVAATIKYVSGVGKFSGTGLGFQNTRSIQALRIAS
jgi:hypothetical protein